MPHYVGFSRRDRVRVRVSFCEALEPGAYGSAEALSGAAYERITAAVR